MPDAHHPLSHHQNDPEKLAKLAKINTYHMKLFAYFLEKLRSTPDGDGTLLDHSMMIYGAGMSNSDLHLHQQPADPAGRRRRGTAQGRPSHQVCR